jgi:hypothetical protein
LIGVCVVVAMLLVPIALISAEVGGQNKGDVGAKGQNKGDVGAKATYC